MTRRDIDKARSRSWLFGGRDTSSASARCHGARRAWSPPPWQPVGTSRRPRPRRAPPRRSEHAPKLLEMMQCGLLSNRRVLGPLGFGSGSKIFGASPQSWGRQEQVRACQLRHGQRRWIGGRRRRCLCCGTEARRQEERRRAGGPHGAFVHAPQLLWRHTLSLSPLARATSPVFWTWS